MDEELVVVVRLGRRRMVVPVRRRAGEVREVVTPPLVLVMLERQVQAHRQGARGGREPDGQQERGKDPMGGRAHGGIVAEICRRVKDGLPRQPIG